MRFTSADKSAKKERSTLGRTGGRPVVYQLRDRSFPRPGESAKQHGLNLRVGKVRIDMSLHPHECSSRLAAGKGVFILPDLRHDCPFVRSGGMNSRNHR